jgi:glycosyltransferase involved in cell wall biosynthesis
VTPKSYLIATSAGSGAVSAHFIALGQELQQRGHRVAILTSTPKWESKAADVGGTVYEWPSPRPGRLRDARFLISVLSQHKPDCVMANFGAVNLFALVHWVRRVPLRIMWYHTLSTQINLDSSLPRWRIRLLRLRKSFVYSQATHVFANSHAAAQDVCETFGVPCSKCSVQTLSLVDPLRHPAHHEITNRTSKITCVGRFSPSKGQDTLMHALAKLRPGLDWRAVLIGDGPSRPSIERLAAELGIGSRCRFLGNCSHDAMLEEMSSAALNVVPSLAEAFGFVAVESMALELPVIASRTGGLAEIIRDSIDGFLVTPGDAAALSQKLEILLTDPELRQRMGTQGRERFLSKFERSRVIPQQADWIEEISQINARRVDQEYPRPSGIL